MQIIVNNVIAAASDSTVQPVTPSFDYLLITVAMVAVYLIAVALARWVIPTIPATPVTIRVGFAGAFAQPVAGGTTNGAWGLLLGSLVGAVVFLITLFIWRKLSAIQRDAEDQRPQRVR